MNQHFTLKLLNYDFDMYADTYSLVGTNKKIESLVTKLFKNINIEPLFTSLYIQITREQHTKICEKYNKLFELRKIIHFKPFQNISSEESSEESVDKTLVEKINKFKELISDEIKLLTLEDSICMKKQNIIKTIDTLQDCNTLDESDISTYSVQPYSNPYKYTSYYNAYNCKKLDTQDTQLILTDVFGNKILNSKESNPQDCDNSSNKNTNTNLNTNDSNNESKFDIFYNTNNEDVFYLYKHKHILASFLLTNEDHNIIKSFPEYNFIFINKVYGSINLLNRYFNKVYTNEEHYNTSYNSYENIYKLINKEKEFNKTSSTFDVSKSNSFEYMIQNCITSRYYITDLLSDRIKADKLCKEIEHNLSDRIKSDKLFKEIENNSTINTSNRIIIRNNLYKCLSKIGIQKKRYSDGYYYYGLVSKLNNNIDTLLQIRNSESNLNTTPSLFSLSEGNNVEPQESVSSMLNYEEYTPLKFEYLKGK